AAEVCDGIDNDCDLDVDEDLLSDWYLDGDEDGYGRTAAVVHACEQPLGFAPAPGDCADNTPSIHPGAVEVCDLVDNDCDGAVDDDDSSLDLSTATTSHPDADEDGYGDLHSAVQRCVVPPGNLLTADDCDDGDGEISPEAAERWYDGVDQDCDLGSDFDQDGDGHDAAAYGGDDLDDADPTCFDPCGYGDGSDGGAGLIVAAGVDELRNQYAAILDEALPLGSHTLTLDDTSALATGDALLVIQMQHPTLAGTWELARVASVSPTTVTLEAPLERDYASGVFGGDSPAAAQVVRVPQYRDFTVAPGATVTAPPWDGSTGGVIALMAQGTITVAGTLDAEGVGFRGGDGGSGASCTNCGGQGGWGGETVTGFAPQGNGGGSNAGGQGHALLDGVKGGSSAGGLGYGGGGEGFGGGGGGGSSDAQPTDFGAGVIVMGPGAGGGGGGGGGNRGFDNQHGGSAGGGGGGAGGGVVLLFADEVVLSGVIDASALQGAGGGGGATGYSFASITGVGGAGGLYGTGGAGITTGGDGLTGTGLGGLAVLDPCGSVYGGHGGTTGVLGGGDGAGGDFGYYDASGGGGAGGSGGGGGGGGFDVAGGGGGGQGAAGGVVYLHAHRLDLGVDRILAEGGSGGGGGGGTTGACDAAGDGGGLGHPSGADGHYAGDLGAGGAMGYTGDSGVIRLEYRDAIAGTPPAEAELATYED
ncbi:MAG: putative metal-binding motif-containing protein, partial [Deltaproteobacteria bacterium]|nr:putative metal-binding motif-containing protein [Deltaproteobacteria bacterium]